MDVPPVFIVVRSSNNVTRAVRDYVARSERKDEGGTLRHQAGALRSFQSHADGGDPLDRRRTVLIDSVALESGDAVDAGFRRARAAEIEASHRERAARGGGDDDVSEAEHLREVMNTIGRAGKLGGAVRCVVSLSMLTEGWDASNVTHILGPRAVAARAGRALRRRGTGRRPSRRGGDGPVARPRAGRADAPPVRAASPPPSPGPAAREGRGPGPAPPSRGARRRRARHRPRTMAGDGPRWPGRPCAAAKAEDVPEGARPGAARPAPSPAAPARAGARIAAGDPAERLEGQGPARARGGPRRPRTRGPRGPARPAPRPNRPAPSGPAPDTDQTRRPQDTPHASKRRRMDRAASLGSGGSSAGPGAPTARFPAPPSSSSAPHSWSAFGSGGCGRGAAPGGAPRSGGRYARCRPRPHRRHGVPRDVADGVVLRGAAS